MKSLWVMLAVCVGAALILAAVSCGDDDDDDSIAGLDGKGICTYKGCRVECTYQPLDPEHNEPDTTTHYVTDSEIITTEEYCNNDDLWVVFEGHIWDGDFYANACPDLDTGYEPADPDTGIVFKCDSTDFEAAN